jgi:hypothetical protein
MRARGVGPEGAVRHIRSLGEAERCGEKQHGSDDPDHDRGPVHAAGRLLADHAIGLEQDRLRIGREDD